MKIITINISKSQTMHEVAMITAYQGVKNDQAALLYDRVAVVKADQPLLEAFWLHSCAVADHILQEYHKPSTPGPHLPKPPDVPDDEMVVRDDYHALLSMPDNWDDTLAPTVEASLRAFFVENMVGRWMALVWPEVEKGHADQADAHLLLVRQGLEVRLRKPRLHFRDTHWKYHEKTTKDNHSHHPTVETTDDL